ncbi:hypothetical protein CDAR_440691 [Caerostris darwini]|uniref:Uncharacterized protein n=1 Tax=Caerostris darwini TaxID=1538125 RepID=A0AAV4MNJ7_9ARAC|nr:hypothetical protein CDAR_440691 [Caerostris darwini]
MQRTRTISFGNPPLPFIYLYQHQTINQLTNLSYPHKTGKTLLSKSEPSTKHMELASTTTELLQRRNFLLLSTVAFLSLFPPFTSAKANRSFISTPHQRAKSNDSLFRYNEVSAWGHIDFLPPKWCKLSLFENRVL